MMRTTLTQSQIDELVEHGLPRAHLPPPRDPPRPPPRTRKAATQAKTKPATSVPPPLKLARVTRSYTPSLPVWIVVPALILLFLILMATLRSKAETVAYEMAPLAPLPAPVIIQVHTNLVVVPLSNIVAVSDRGWRQLNSNLTDLAASMNAVQGRMLGLSQQAAQIPTLIENQEKLFTQRMMAMEMTVTGLANRVEHTHQAGLGMEGELFTAIDGMRAVQADDDMELRELRENTNSLFWLTGAGVTILLLGIIGVWTPRFRRCSGKQAKILHSPKPNPDLTPPNVAIPPPAETMARMILRAAGNADIPVKPALTGAGWQSAVATAKGQVRSENQDYGLTFCIGERCVVVVADGVGGQREGGRAAYLAVTASSAHLIYYLSRHCREENLATLLNEAMLSAGHALTLEGAQTGIYGLRTTLILVVATPSRYYFSHIGDGGGAVVRADGHVERFVVPQLVPGTRNVLSASLGPVTEGMPRFGQLPVAPDDVLMAGSDGVFSCVDDAFYPDIAAALKTYLGDVRQVAELAVNNLADAMDGPCVCCEDNLTLALLMRGDTPGDNRYAQQ